MTLTIYATKQAAIDQMVVGELAWASDIHNLVFKDSVNTYTPTFEDLKATVASLRDAP